MTTQLTTKKRKKKLNELTGLQVRWEWEERRMRKKRA